MKKHIAICIPCYNEINNIEELYKRICKSIEPINEYKLSHLDGSINLPLYDIITKKNFLNKETKYLIHCQTGYRSMIASSLLKNMGFEVVEIKHGFIGFLNSNSKKIKS